MDISKRSLGRWGEEKAAIYLKKQGYKILEQNARTSYGEIDIVASKYDTIIFVEVKTRRSKAYGNPEESITQEKREHIINSGQAYLVDHPELGSNWQIDVISIQCDQGNVTEIIHFENAISE
jgi:putative endonuclease